MPLIQTTGLTLPSSAQRFGNPGGLPSGFANELIISELMPPYYAMLKLGIVYYTVASAINPTAFNGGAAGVPIFGLYNPIGSGKDLIILQTRIGVRTTGTAAVTWNTNWWFGPSVLPTGTRTNPFNAYTQAQTGSSAACFVNTAMTGSTALTGGPVPVLSGGLTAAAAVTNVQQTQDGSTAVLMVAPGILAALGQSAAMTAGVIDAAIVWAELAA